MVHQEKEPGFNRVLFLGMSEGLEPWVEHCQWQCEESLLGRDAESSAKRKRRSPLSRTNEDVPDKASLKSSLSSGTFSFSGAPQPISV
jgi:hypothetical protein